MYRSPLSVGPICDCLASVEAFCDAGRLLVEADEYLDRICPPPRMWASREGLARFQHDDLRELGDDDLVREIKKVDMRLSLEHEPHRWFWERYQRCLEEQARREEMRRLKRLRRRL
jgi:hypothetical protein